MTSKIPTQPTSAASTPTQAPPPPPQTTSQPAPEPAPATTPQATTPAPAPSPTKAPPAPAPTTSASSNNNNNDNNNNSNSTNGSNSSSSSSSSNSSSSSGGSSSTGGINPSSTVNQNPPPTLLSLTPTFSSTVGLSLASSTTDTSSVPTTSAVTSAQNSPSSDSGGASAGLMIGVMLGGTILIVALIILVVRRKVDSLRSMRRGSHKLYDTEYNDDYTVGQTYHEKQDYIMESNNTLAPPDTALLSPSSPGAEYNHHYQGNRVSFAPMSSQRQSIYRQSTGALYQPPASLMPVNGRFIPAGNRQSTFTSYPTYNPYSQ